MSNSTKLPCLICKEPYVTNLVGYCPACEADISASFTLAKKTSKNYESYRTSVQRLCGREDELRAKIKELTRDLEKERKLGQTVRGRLHDWYYSNHLPPNPCTEWELEEHMRLYHGESDLYVDLQNNLNHHQFMHEVFEGRPYMSWLWTPNSESKQHDHGGPLKVLENGKLYEPRSD
jgi:hypothetical protein